MRELADESMGEQLILARHTAFGSWFWGQFSKWAIKLRFHDFRYEQRIEVDPARAMLMLGNHISWWDGFWPLHLCRKYLGKKFHVMMLEEQLKKRRFMRQGGAFSISPGRRSMLQSLDYASSLLGKPENMVMIYPQGKIHSMSDPYIHFEKGLERVLKKAVGKYQIVFSVALVDFFSHDKATIFYYLETWQSEKMGESHEESALSRAELEKAYNRFYRSCISRQAEKRS